MSISTLLRCLTRRDRVAALHVQKARADMASKSARPALLPGRFRRKGDTRTSYLNTGYLSNHVLKDIGLERTDLTKPE